MIQTYCDEHCERYPCDEKDLEPKMLCKIKHKFEHLMDNLSETQGYCRICQKFFPISKRVFDQIQKANDR